MTSLSDTLRPLINEVDIESKMPLSHWVMGVQVQCYPHVLLMAVLDCLKVMGFVLRDVMVEMAF
jgi:hypothetical protein